MPCNRCVLCCTEDLAATFGFINVFTKPFIVKGQRQTFTCYHLKITGLSSRNILLTVSAAIVHSVDREIKKCIQYVSEIILTSTNSNSSHQKELDLFTSI